ncbi:MAG TPA: glycosyl transferase family 1, partial [Thermoanaerobaculia bacterium]
RIVRVLASRYLGFVNYAFDHERGRFRNFMSYSRQWRDEDGSEDSHGRALWALGTVVGRSADPGRQSLARSLFHSALPAVSEFSSPRAWAFTLLGVEQYLHAFEGDRGVQEAGRAIAERLHGLFRRTDQPDWPWCESRVTYCNARLPQALIASGAWIGDAEMTATGLRSLQWLMTIQRTPDGYFAPVGTNGFFDRGMVAASFDQQPVEACGTVSACMQAFRYTGEHHWAESARRAFTWFFGQNQLQEPLYDVLTGGCRDALHVDRVNQNEGAESTLSFLMALMDMRADEVRWNAMQVPVTQPAEVVVAVSAGASR